MGQTKRMKEIEVVAACVLEKCYKIALQTSQPDGQEKIKLFSKQYGSPIKEESWWNIWGDRIG
jgi:hypothetical protein|tara:strand:+ start:64 stop:252 length:189 start_codon:yes stop_codon:yes gene_type:complete